MWSTSLFCLVDCGQLPSLFCIVNSRLASSKAPLHSYQEMVLASDYSISYFISFNFLFCVVDLIWFCVVDFLVLRPWLTTQFCVINFPLCFAKSTASYLPLKHYCTATSTSYQHLTTLFLILFHRFYLFLIHSGCYELIPSAFPRAGRLPSPDLPVGFPFQISQSAPIKAQLLVDTTHIWLLYFSFYFTYFISF